MSLLDGMNNLFENKAAMEAATDEAIFEEMIPLIIKEELSWGLVVESLLENFIIFIVGFE